MIPRFDYEKTCHGAIPDLHFHTILPNYIRMATKQYR
jgi:hypothetical protein